MWSHLIPLFLLNPSQAAAEGGWSSGAWGRAAWGRSDYGRAVQERIALTDQILARVGFSSAVAETAQGTETYSPRLTGFATVLEQATAAYQLAIRVDFRSAVAETATGVDGTQAQVALVGSVAESAAGLDSPNSVPSYTALISETTRLSAVPVPGTVTAIDVTPEFARATFTQVNQGFFNASLDENAAAQDVSEARVAFLAFVLETAELAEAVVAQVRYVVAMDESARLGYALTGKFLWDPLDDSQDPSWQPVLDPQNPGWTPVDDAQQPIWVPVNT